jgi:hypothetical protein
MNEYDNNDYGSEMDYSDSDRLDEMNTAEDYNRWEEEQVARDMEAGEGDPDYDYENDYPADESGSMSDQLHDMMMEDRIGGTGYDYDDY